MEAGVEGTRRIHQGCGPLPGRALAKGLARTCSAAEGTSALTNVSPRVPAVRVGGPGVRVSFETQITRKNARIHPRVLFVGGRMSARE
jgi:hypothetical protein